MDNIKKEKAKRKRCYNCKHAGEPFKVLGKKNLHCEHIKHLEGLESGELSPWDTLRSYHNTCESHEFKAHKQCETQTKIQ